MKESAAIIDFPVRDAAPQGVRDSYANFAAQVGINTDNISAFGTYTFNFITRNRILLEAMYRGSWIVGNVIDYIADDMTQAGIEMQTDMKPQDIDLMSEAFDDLQIWESLNATIKWGGLYGSSVGVYLIDGQDMSTPLDIETVGRGQFKGILPMDRWQLVPSLGHLIDEYGPNMGLPMYYRTLPDAIIPDLGVIHYTRLFRYDTIDLPHYQKLTENLWAESIVERIFDRIEAFDSTTQGAAQLVFKAYLRTLSVEGLRDIVAAGGKAMQGLTQSVNLMRRFQTNEGISMIDAKDKLEANTYTFAGLDDILLKFGEQISGASGIPMVRLFGQSPAGLNATGDADIRSYYDGIHKKQNTKLKRPVKMILGLVHRSLFGKSLPPGFSFQFNPLWQMTDEQKSNMASKDTVAINDAFTSGLVSRATALKELRQNSKTNGMWSNVSDKDISDAESEPPLSEFTQTPEEAAEMQQQAEGEPDADKKAD